MRRLPLTQFSDHSHLPAVSHTDPLPGLTAPFPNRSLDPRKQAEETEEEENAKWRRLMTILVALALYLLTAVLLQESFQLQSQAGPHATCPD